MKKSSLRTVKEKNRRLILRALLTEGGLSRIELAKQTGLSPSTITALVGELLAEGVVQESGLRAATAGRSRAGLTICPDYGRVVVVDIGRSHAVLYLYDMALQCVFRTVLPDHGGDGNELLTSISDAIFQGFSMEELHAGKMKSIGLLFQDDTEISEFRVMYSTGYTAATISLREALFTQFKVPIVEEYSRVYTVSRALAEAGKSVGSNYAHIDLGDRAVVQIVQKEQPVALRSEGQADITGLLLPEGGSLLELAQNFEAAPPAQQAAALKNTQSPVSCFTVRLSNVARMLCSLFVIEKLYLSGPAAASPAFMRGVVSTAAMQSSSGGVIGLFQQPFLFVQHLPCDTGLPELCAPALVALQGPQIPAALILDGLFLPCQEHVRVCLELRNAGFHLFVRHGVTATLDFFHDSDLLGTV